jgi:hypothetical protein
VIEQACCNTTAAESKRINISEASQAFQLAMSVSSLSVAGGGMAVGEGFVLVKVPVALMSHKHACVLRLAHDEALEVLYSMKETKKGSAK